WSFALSIVGALPVLAAAEPGIWNIDPVHTSSQFSVKHLVISTVRGQFGKTTGRLKLDEQDIAKSSVEAVVDVNTIDTRVADRDKHLKSPDFFDVANYPTMAFRSSKVVKAGEGRLKVGGDLTIRGTTRPVTFDVAYSPRAVGGMMGEIRRGFTATANINRRDFGLRWSKTVNASSTMDPVVGDEVAIVIDAEAVKEDPKMESRK
ncbi:MAG TPA: YceI family protein, partial [Anaeromyxobacteraceae bacterium]|nr:YceI family protein [Anaeromyxobacteraceae bacterium]